MRACAAQAAVSRLSLVPRPFLRGREKTNGLGTRLGMAYGNEAIIASIIVTQTTIMCA